MTQWTRFVCLGIDSNGELLEYDKELRIPSNYWDCFIDYETINLYSKIQRNGINLDHGVMSYDTT